MNENACCVKESPCRSVAEICAKEILSLSLSDQNETFSILRQLLCQERNAYIDSLIVKDKLLQEEIAYAQNSLKAIFIAELK